MDEIDEEYLAIPFYKELENKRFEHSLYLNRQYGVNFLNYLNDDIFDLSDFNTIILDGHFGFTEKEFKKIKKIILPKNLKYILNGTFYSFYNVNEIEFNDKILAIGCNAFYRSKIEFIEFPKSLVFIGNAAFSAANLKTMIINSDICMPKAFEFNYLNCNKINIIFSNNTKLRYMNNVLGNGNYNMVTDDLLEAKSKNIDDFVNNYDEYFKDIPINCLSRFVNNDLQKTNEYKIFIELKRE